MVRVIPVVASLPLSPVCPVAGLGAFSVTREGPLQVPILFASPHSGSLYPETLLSGLRVPVMDLRRTEDAFVDELFADAPDFGGWLVHANYARAYVDLNRDARELDPGMFADGPPRPTALPSARVEAGLGCLPRVAACGEPIYAARLSRAEGEYRLSQVHDAYHAFIRTVLEEARERFGQSVLIDCHSMPSRQPGRRQLADIVLGDRFGSSCDSRLTGLAERTFRKLGYSVSRNSPYAGGYTTRAYGRPKRHVHVLQIEVNRALYMDEETVMPSADFARVRSDMRTVAELLTRFVAASLA